MAKKKVDVQAVVEEQGYPEVGHFTDKKDLQKFYKALDTEQLEEWVELEGLDDQVKATDSAPIYRMRLCMAILYLHFPKAPAKKKSKRKYELETEQYVQMAIDNDVIFETADDERILRMRAIMALRAHNIIE